jgi:hypothetical protein
MTTGISLAMRTLTVTALLLFASMPLCALEQRAEFHRTITVSNAEPVMLVLELASADLEITYSRDGQVSVSAVAQVSGDSRYGDNELQSAVVIEQAGNTLKLRQVPDDLGEKVKIRYRLEVPYRSAVRSVMEQGKVTVRGVSGPVEVQSRHSDVNISYVSEAAHIEVGSGNLELQVIGGRVRAKSGQGNISGQRLPGGISAETDDGDITLMEIGESDAAVNTGTGRIEVEGARDSLVSSTKGGNLHVRAVPHNDWKLSSESGTIRVELPDKVDSDLLASTESGEIQVDRDDLPKAAVDARRLLQRIHGGSHKIEVHTTTGRIVIR